MAKISELPIAGPLIGSETIPLVQDGEVKQAEFLTVLDEIQGEGAEQVIVLQNEATTQIGNISAAGATAITIASAAATAAAAAAGTLTPAQILSIDSAVSLPNAPSFRTSANRLKRIGQCNWAKCTTNEPRIYTGNSGAIEGVIFDGAEAIKSADYFTAPANSSSPQWITVNGTGATVSQVGGHSLPDIAGGTGKLVSGVAGSATTQFRALNLAQSVVNGDVMRIGALVQFPVTGASYQPRLLTFQTSGTNATSSAIITVSATGVPTISANSARAAGCDLFDTDALGNRWYRVWCDIAITATGTLAPVLQVPLSTGTFKFMLWSVKNPTQSIPSLVPVMGDASFAADSIQLGTTAAVEVEWTELCVGRTSISDGLLVPPRNAATPVLALEKRITVKPATEITGIAYALPGPRHGLLLANSGAVSVVLGPGQFLSSITATNIATSYSITGAYADPKRWPILRYGRFFGSTLTSLTLDRVCFWLRTPRGSGTDIYAANLSIEVAPSIVTLGDILVVGAQGEWSQFATNPESGNVTPYTQFRFGGLAFVPGANSGTLTFGRAKVVRAGRGVTITASTGQTFNFTGTGFAADKITTDSMFITGAGSTINITLGHQAHGDVEGASEAFYQTPYEIEVDTGSGWQSLAASGLAVTSLPLWRKFYNYGTHTTGTITASPNPRQVVWVSSFAFTTGSGYVTKPGYQYNVSNGMFTDASGNVQYYSPFLGDGSVWVSDSVGTPTTGNPRIRIRHQASKWTSSSVVASNSGNPLVIGAGVHGDHFQTGIAAFTYSYSCNNVLFLGAGGQGFFQNGPSTICSGLTARGIFALDYGNGMYFTQQSGAINLSGLLTRKESLYRGLLTGAADMPQVRPAAGVTVTATGLYIGTTSGASTGIGGAGTVTGQTLFAIDRISGNTTVIPAVTDQPSVPLRGEQFFPPNMLQNGTLGPWVTPSNIAVTGFASERLGFDVPALIRTCQNGAWGMFAELEAICTLGSPTHYSSVSNAAAVDTSLTLTANTGYTTTLKGKTITQGDPRRLFRLENGVIKVNAALTDMYGAALTDNVALVTDAGERVSVRVS